jgi:hypothetical protein
MDVGLAGSVEAEKTSGLNRPSEALTKAGR